mgnify:FL=1
MYRCIFIIFISLSLLLSQNFRYDDKDWYILSSPSSINAISEDNFFVYFASNDGIYKYDKILDDIKLDNSFFINIENPQISHFFYDKYHDMYWVVHREGISYKSSIESIWRDLPNLNINNYFEIQEIGSSPEYFWVKYRDNLYPFSPYNSIPIKHQDAMEELNYIYWGHSYKGSKQNDLDFSSYIIEGDWQIGFKGAYHKDGRSFNINIIMVDDSGNRWFGTDSGYILKGWRNSTRLEIINLGLAFNNITEAYFDNIGNWWFASSRMKQLGQLPNYNNIYQFDSAPFISQWYEEENKWTYYMPSDSPLIQSKEINCILRIGSIIYFGTTKGLLYLDLYNDEWNLIDDSDGLNDEIILDILEFQESIIVLTTKGINEISITNHIVIPNKSYELNKLKKHNIFDIEAKANNLYIASDIGLLKFNWDQNNLVIISQKKLKKISIVDNNILGSDGTLWKIDNLNFDELISHNVDNYVVCDHFIWMINDSKIELLNSITNHSWQYSAKDGIPGNIIYDVNCDDEWVWFLTNKGVAFYNWGKYHKIR